MHGWRFAWVTFVPLVWLVTVTFTAGLEKIFSPLPRVGFLAQASQTAGRTAFNARLDAVVTAVFLVLVAVILLDSLRVWAGILLGTGERQVRETPFQTTRLRTEEL